MCSSNVSNGDISEDVDREGDIVFVNIVNKIEDESETFWEVMIVDKSDNVRFVLLLDVNDN